MSSGHLFHFKTSYRKVPTPHGDSLSEVHYDNIPKYVRTKTK